MSFRIEYALHPAGLFPTRFTLSDASGRSTGMEGPQPFFVKHSIARYSDVSGDNGGAAIVTPSYAGIEEIGEENLCRYEGSAVQYACVTETRTSSSGTFLTEYRYRLHGFHPSSVTSKTFHNRDILFPFTDNGYLDGLAASKTVYRTADGQHAVSVRERYGYDIIESSPLVFRQKALSLQNVYSDGGSMEKAVDKYYYGTYELVSAMVLPTETRTESCSPNGRDSTSVIFDRHDSYGNPLSAVLDGTQKRFYLWSYNGKYPVAEISGTASYSDAYDDFGHLLSAISPAVNAIGSVEKAIKETYKYNYKH